MYIHTQIYDEYNTFLAHFPSPHTRITPPTYLHHNLCPSI